MKKRCQEIEINSANELKEKLEQLTKDLNDKWTRKLKSVIESFFTLKLLFFSRFDTEKIRKDLTQQKDEEKQKAIDELLKQKQSNISSAQTQINELEQQVRFEDLLRNQQIIDYLDSSTSKTVTC